MNPVQKMIRSSIMVTALCAGTNLSHAETQAAEWSPAQTAGVQPHGILRFEILDEEGGLLPARLTFVAQDGSLPALFPNTQARPKDLAVRQNVVYTLSGAGAITIPVGTYTVWVSRGLEYKVQSRTIEFKAGSESIWTPTLVHEIDTSGWVSGDFHLHTLTHSGHGDSNMPERVISLIGEGVEFAVATDHNHNTDYEPTMTELGVPDAMRAVVGNEVSTPIGHFNAFPLDANEPLINPDVYDAHELFRVIREQPNQFGTVPVVQVNHPRWGGIDYFGQFNLDPITASTLHAKFSYDFDSVEIFNENEGWGYIDADESDLPLGSGSFSVLRDWFNLLNRGYRIAAVGNSDSHNVQSELAGWPRNFIVSSTDTPGLISPAEIAANIRAKRVYTTLGPVVDFSINETPMGGEANTLPNTKSGRAEGEIDIAIRVQVPSWISCDRVMIVVNGETVKTIDVSDQKGVIRLDTVERMNLDRDSWVSLLVEGDTPLDPIVHTQGRPIYPWAVLNPVWIDADNDGRWVAPIDQARLTLRQLRPDDVRRSLIDAPNAQWENTLIAAAESDTFFEQIIREGLSHPSRRVRLAAAGAFERQLSTIGKIALSETQRHDWIRTLRDAYAMASGDEHLRLRLLLALKAAGDQRVQLDALTILTVEDHRRQLRNGFMELLSQLVGGAFITEWSIAGNFTAPSFGTLQLALTPAEINPTIDSYPGSNGSDEPIGWVDTTAESNGYINLETLQPDQSPDNAIATARVWFNSDGTEIAFTFGADDASRIMLNGEVIYEEHTDHSADPLQHIGTMKPKNGLNLLTVSVENGSGGYGFFLRMLDDEAVRSVMTREPMP
ncbi:MAG: CehA/McbA family metallohydrolase [Phycisphaerales bacterium]|nr:CehA/McbA family metallohydrolase [Phycisphaerales bacterium]